MEETRFHSLVQNFNIDESTNTELLENEDQTRQELNNIKKEILEKIKKIFSNKKSFLILCMMLLASQTGIFLPVSSILRIGNNIINSDNILSSMTSSSIDLNSIPSNDPRLRDIYDLAVKKLFEFVKDYKNN